MSTEKNEYVLGTHDAELERLGLQHRVWSAQAMQVWTLAGFAPGQTILDVGCGPGFATLDLAEWLGDSARVIAIDQSERYIRFLQQHARARNLSGIDARIGNVESLDLAPGSIDAAYCRWVLCWIRDPLACVRGVTRALRRGGVFAVQDYFSYQSITLAPRSDAFTRVVRAVVESQRAGGGDPDLAGRMPRMLMDCECDVLSIEPVLRAARPGSPLWQWPDTFFRTYVPRLVSLGFLTERDQAAFLDDWEKRCADPATFVMTPPVFNIIARKR